jgi:hypothetical protein
LKLSLGESLRDSGHGHLVTLAVDGDRPGDDWRRWGRGRTSDTVDSSHHRLNSGQQHCLSYGLDQVVVGSRAKPENYRTITVPGGHDDHGHCRCESQRMQDVQPIHVGQPEIQEHQIATLDAVKCVGAAAGPDNGRAGLAEKLGQRRRDTLVVFDEQHTHGADVTKPSPQRGRY